MLLRAGCDPRALDHNGRSPSDEIANCADSWVIWADALLEADWHVRAVNGLVQEPLVPAQDVLDGTYLHYTWQGILGWVRPLRSVVSTRIEEVNDAGPPMTMVDLTEELDNAAASEVVVHLTWNTCTERGSWTQDGV